MGQDGRSPTNADYLLLLVTGIILGFLSALVGNIFYGILSTTILALIFAICYPILNRPQSLRVSFITGGGIGLILGCLDWLISDTIFSVSSGFMFGLTRGGALGGIVGLITRASSDKQDSIITKTFLFFGSIFMGTFLGGSVGAVTGVTLGIIGTGDRSVIGGIIIGSIVGGYLGSYYHKQRWIRAGVVAGAALAAVSALAGAPVAGVILGAMSGAIVPMLFVAAIGAIGGLTSRGVKAMLLEAIEAPTEMLEQGAVPFLVPALITGLIVGATSDTDGLIALPTSLTLVAALLGTLAEFGRRANTPEITLKTIIEMAMMGAENWPVTSLVKQLTTTIQEKETLRSMGIQASIGIVGALIGIAFAYIALVTG